MQSKVLAEFVVATANRCSALFPATAGPPGRYL